MPAQVIDDWSAVRDTAVALGSIAEAAKVHGVSYGAARVRAHRENWPIGHRPSKALKAAKATVTAAIKSANPKAVTAVTSAQAVSDVVAERGRETRSHYSEYALKTAKHAAKLSPAKALKASRQVKDAFAVASGTFVWQLHGKRMLSTGQIHNIRQDRNH